ncbi:AraC family transcriptional regulator [Roseomonas sp. NAR14]|uniref:AraC family transcriptional regulator n=1 Tax=Roseomonas acroporae TaxID=2937791 RepID=A0A9X1YD27_9PROT|nr:AraC family transcriptional regulator [Roseomonas acroporae]MCK8787552.1 AraC family transcriptional regulator [Roseomonas acroporae]
MMQLPAVPAVPLPPCPAGLPHPDAARHPDGAPSDAAAATPGGLAAWQVRRVRRLVAERLSEPLSVMEMASAARLSRSAFFRGFGASFGCAPHAWLLEQRIERAKRMMRDGEEPLAQIALACGLADQAHLSRVFRRHAGETPSRWRRAAAACPAA